MEEARKRKEMKNPDSQYRFFPTNEDWTWAKRDIFSDEEAQGTRKEWGRAPRSGPTERVADKGWKGMKEARAAGSEIRGSEGWTTVGPRNPRSNANTQGEGTSRTNPNYITIDSNVTFSQLKEQSASQRKALKRLGGPMDSGRQSRLGDFWREKSGKGREDGEDLDEQSDDHPLDTNL